MLQRQAEKTRGAAMWHAMFAEQVPLAEKILRTVIVYALIAVPVPADGQAEPGEHEYLRRHRHLPAVQRGAERDHR
jgi:hypothetical protein